MDRRGSLQDRLVRASARRQGQEEQGGRAHHAVCLGCRQSRLRLRRHQASCVVSIDTDRNSVAVKNVPTQNSKLCLVTARVCDVVLTRCTLLHSRCHSHIFGRLPRNSYIAHTALSSCSVQNTDPNRPRIDPRRDDRKFSQHGCLALYSMQTAKTLMATPQVHPGEHRGTALTRAE